jgi:hypothetical protein
VRRDVDLVPDRVGDAREIDLWPARTIIPAVSRIPANSL